LGTPYILHSEEVIVYHELKLG